VNKTDSDSLVITQLVHPCAPAFGVDQSMVLRIMFMFSRSLNVIGLDLMPDTWRRVVELLASLRGRTGGPEIKPEAL
jgi:hypothetical protein